MTVVKIKKQKAQKCVPNCLEATQLPNKIHHLEKNKTGIDSLKKDQKNLIRNNKLILKP